MRRKIFWLAAALIVALAALVVLRSAALDSGDSSGRVRVAASFYPLAEFARQVGGERVDVTTLVAPGVEPHDYDPSPRDIAGVHDSQVFIFNGAGLEPWAEKIKNELSAGGVVVVTASDGLLLIPAGADTPQSDGASRHDPHVWLDPVLASREVDNIKAGLEVADPEGAEIYEANATAYKSKLEELAGDYESGLKDCGGRQIVTSHQAFGYLAARYQLDVMAISGLSPEEEPSPQKLADIARFVRENDVRYIFFETLVSPKLADTIAGETGAKTLVFNPLEGLTEDAMAQGQNYITVQRQNLDNLRTALDCK
jgi:zinc transport system substrate-binding protein